MVTTRGHALVLVRFADAVAETAPEAGMQVHRSHWVADRAVERLLSQDGRLSLLLVNGRRIPVSRPYVADARDRFSGRG